MLSFAGMLLTYFLNDFEMFPVASIITGITLVFYIIIIIIIITIIYLDIFISHLPHNSYVVKFALILKWLIFNRWRLGK